MASTRAERSTKAACRRFTTLMVDLHARMGLPSPAASPPGQGQSSAVELEWRQVRFRIEHEPVLDPASLVVQCFYGMPSQGRIQDVLMRLLEVNHVLAIKRAGATFGVDPESGEAVYLFAGTLSDVTDASLFSALKLAACHALHWRESFLLGDPFRVPSAGAEGPHVMHV